MGSLNEGCLEEFVLVFFTSSIPPKEPSLAQALLRGLWLLAERHVAPIPDRKWVAAKDSSKKQAPNGS